MKALWWLLLAVVLAGCGGPSYQSGGIDPACGILAAQAYTDPVMQGLAMSRCSR